MTAWLLGAYSMQRSSLQSPPTNKAAEVLEMCYVGDTEQSAVNFAKQPDEEAADNRLYNQHERHAPACSADACMGHL
jgi:hypothetical protein